MRREAVLRTFAAAQAQVRWPSPPRSPGGVVHRIAAAPEFCREAANRNPSQLPRLAKGGRAPLVQRKRELQPQRLWRHLGGRERLAAGFIKRCRSSHTSQSDNCSLAMLITC